MMRSPRLALFFFLVTVAGGVLIASCLPDSHELVGRPCDAEHACGEEALVCCQGACQPFSVVGSCDDDEPSGPPGAGDGGRDGGLPDAGDGGEVPPQDGGSGDGGLPDAGRDAGTGTADGGDAGMPPDAGPPDAGPPDAGPPDAGPPDAGPPCPPDLLLYGGFEQATDLSHFASNGSSTYSRTTAVARTGQYGVHIVHDPSVSDNYYGLRLDDDVLTSLTIGKNYCASAWLKRGSVRGDMRVITRYYSTSASNDIATVRVTPPDDEWFLIINDQAYITSTYPRSVTLRTSVTPSAGTEYYVDDMHFWESEAGVCDPRCAR